MTLSSMAFAQAVDESALEELDRQAPVVAPSSEPAGATELRAAMRRISLSPTDADALADAIMKVASLSPEKQLIMAHNGKQMVFSEHDKARQFEKILGIIIQAAQSSVP